MFFSKKPRLRQYPAVSESIKKIKLRGIQRNNRNMCELIDSSW